MHNAKLDFGEIFSLKSLRKNNKLKAQGIKYLDRPFPSIKPVKQIIFNMRGSRFALLTDKQVFVFDNFTKQNMYMIPIDNQEFSKIIFFNEDLVAINEKEGMFYFREEMGNYKFKAHVRKAEIDETGFTDIENVEDSCLVLVGNLNLHLVRVLISKNGKIHSEVSAQLKSSIKKLKFLKSNREQTEFLYLDYSDPSRIRFCIFDREFSPIKQVLTVPTNLERRVSPTEDKMNIENQVESESEPVPSLPTSIDQCIYIPQIDAVIIVDLQNGLFLARLEGENTATLKPYFQLDNYDKIKLRCVCLCMDYQRSPILCMFSMRQTHQHVQFKPITSNDEPEILYEISESKIKAKRVYFNAMWNSFMILDYDDNYYLMEFYNHNYYEKYWIRFKSIDENLIYQEEETEFDQSISLADKRTQAELDKELLDQINGRR